MNATTNFKQRGAVLAFTLFMLALLTLAGVTMVQQNKLDFMMVKNSRQQTQALASAEQLLTSSENAIMSATVGGVAVHSPCNSPNGTAPACGDTGFQPVVCDTAVTPANLVSCPLGGAIRNATLACRPTVKTSGTVTKLVQTQLIAGSRPTGLPAEATIVAVSCLKDTQLTGNNDLYEKLCSTYDTATSVTKLYPGNTATNTVSPPETCTSPCTTPVPAVTGNSSLWACYQPFKATVTDAECSTEIYTIRISFTDSNGANRTIESKYGVNCGIP